MIRNKFILAILTSIFVLISSLNAEEIKNKKRIAYLVSDISIPYWNIMSKGIKKSAEKYNYEVEIFSANNNKKNELENTFIALNKKKVDGLIISPINSSTAKTILKFANKANVPVVISDIGTSGGSYVSYISSNNTDGSYKIGKILAEKMAKMNFNKDASVGIIAIPQKRANGIARTKGFIKAMEEHDIKSAGLLQQVDFSYEETYKLSKKLINNNPNLKALWLQGSDKYQAALDAIKDSKKEGEILLLCFDAEPEFLEMIPEGKLLVSAMQQPFLMGEKSIEKLYKHLNGQEVKKNIKLEVLVIWEENIKENLSLIKRNVLGIEEE